MAFADRATRLAVVAALGCLVVGCSGPDGQSLPTPTKHRTTSNVTSAPATTQPGGSAQPGDVFAPTPEEVAAGAGWVSPLQSWLPSEEQKNVAQQAAAILYNQCMDSYGLDVPPGMKDTAAGIGLGTSGPKIPDLGLEQYNPRMEQWADSLPPDQPAPPSDPKFENPEYVLVDVGNGDRKTHPRPTRKKVNGKEVYPSGCKGWVEDQISGAGVVAAGEDPRDRQIIDEASRRIRSDPRFTKVLGQWRTCMKDRGYTFDAVEHVATFRDTEPPTDELDQMRRTAQRAAFECQREVGYGPTLFRVTKDWDTRIAEQHALVIQEMKDARDREVERAAKVIEENR